MITLLKLGGSLITDKRKSRTYLPQVMQRLAREVRQALVENPDVQLIIGHGSGSFGHDEAHKHGTMTGVQTSAQWQGFAQVAVVAASLSQLVTETLLQADVPAFRVQPSASVVATDGVVTQMSIDPIQHSLRVGLVPVVYGDVALDTVRGGTITSTETIFTFLTTNLPVSRIILLGKEDGVYDQQQNIIHKITPDNFSEIRSALGGSEATDVTGGMLTKVVDSLQLATNPPYPIVQIANGSTPDLLRKALLGEQIPGTTITHG